MKPEKEESPKDEMKETPEQQEKEKKEGTEEHNTHIVPEEFQHKCKALIDECQNSKQCLSYMRDMINKAEDELRRKEMEAKNKGKKKVGDFSMDSAPSSLY